MNANVRVRRDKNRGDLTSGVQEMVTQLDSGHLRHLNIGDEAAGNVELRRRKEVSGRRKRRDWVTQRLQ
jgi:hypothetical protein